jgi:hypothetical protein
MRVLALAADATLAWIEQELAREAITLQIARSVAHAVSALVEDPPPRATILVCDFDALDPLQLLELHQIRERGWFGVIVGLGDVPAALRTSLAITHVISPPYVTNLLRSAIARTGIGLSTTRMPKLDD